MQCKGFSFSPPNQREATPSIHILKAERKKEVLNSAKKYTTYRVDLFIVKTKY